MPRAKEDKKNLEELLKKSFSSSPSPFFDLGVITQSPLFSLSAFFRWVRILLNKPSNADEEKLVDELKSRGRISSSLVEKIFKKALSVFRLNFSSFVTEDVMIISCVPKRGGRNKNIEDAYSLFSPWYPFLSIFLGTGLRLFQRLYREKKKGFENLESAISETLNETKLYRYFHFPMFLLLNDEETIGKMLNCWGREQDDLAEKRKIPVEMAEFVTWYPFKAFALEDFRKLYFSEKTENLPEPYHTYAKVSIGFSLLLSENDFVLDEKIMQDVVRNISNFKSRKTFLYSVFSFLFFQMQSFLMLPQSRHSTSIYNPENISVSYKFYCFLRKNPDFYKEVEELNRNSLPSINLEEIIKDTLFTVLQAKDIQKTRLTELAGRENTVKKDIKMVI